VTGEKFVALPRYQRLGGAGMRRVLWECLWCGCAVANRDVHDNTCTVKR
jgi:hypothetical protein